MQSLRQGVILTVIILALLFPCRAQAQVMDNSRRVDTLSLAERLSLRTNIVDWSLMVPNVGVEYDLRRENWSRYSLNLNIRYRPRTSGTFVRPVRFDLFEATVEGRMYWRERKATPNGYLRRHNHWWDKLFSCRTMLPSHPNWIFYRGVYLSYSDYDLYLSGHDGRQGEMLSAGFTWGFVKPFLAFQNGSSVDMEFGVSAGIGYTGYDRFRHDNERNVYYRTGTRDWHIVKYPVVRDLHVAMVYRFGRYPIQRKYRWRYDVDMAFRNRRDADYSDRLLYRERQFVRDSIYRVVSRDFRELYDSCVNERRMEKQKAIDAKAPKRLEQAVEKRKGKGKE